MKKLLVLFAVLFSSSASAIPINIQSCIDNFTCSVDGIAYNSTIDGNSITAYYMTDDREGTSTSKRLIDYQLGSASSTSNDDPSLNFDLTGNLWLEVQTIYDPSDSLHKVSLHFDQVTPSYIPSGLSDGTANELRLLITTDALLTGHASTYVLYDDHGTPSTPHSLFDSSGSVPQTCLAGGCFSFDELNLLTLQYSEGRVGYGAYFNPDETREQLFKTGGGSDAEYGFSTYTLNAAAVPVPSALPLFLSGCLLLLYKRRKKVTDNNTGK